MLKTLTTCYAIFLILVVLLADAGYLSSLMAWLHYLPAGDKLCHFLLVGGLSFLVTASWSWHHPRYRYRLAVMTIVAISAVTCLEECSQSMLSHRRYDPGDMACNIAGSWCFGLSALLLPVKRREQERV